MSTSNKIIFVVLVIFVFVIPVLAQEKTNDYPVLKGPYLGQEPPGMIPEVFAPGIVSTADYTELGCTFSPDGKEFYFSRYTETRDIWVCRLKDNGWQKPEPAPFNTSYREMSPHITADGNKLFFVSTRPHTLRSGDPKNWSMWVSMRNATEWEEPFFLGTGIYLTSSKMNNIFLSYFTEGGVVIGQTKFVNSGFSEIKSLEGDMNSPYFDNHPCIAPDESYILFESNRPGSHRVKKLLIFTSLIRKKMAHGVKLLT
ncbi:MAG: hypothetical protein GTN53_19985 [Candidatus Aminicenantes bacterium]|nr:hypothetical protein [Candidatus Aminicenantes bacterium]NIQ68751.1 hypothetical protein [Candidatus Aminicenantes bacterium]NIT24783.1 hypothetical protein [Candidatus Aminicenantes bacterium]